MGDDPQATLRRGPISPRATRKLRGRTPRRLARGAGPVSRRLGQGERTIHRRTSQPTLLVALGVSSSDPRPSRAGDGAACPPSPTNWCAPGASEDQRLAAVAKAAVAVLARQNDESLKLLADALPKDEPPEPTPKKQDLRPRLQRSLASATKIDTPLYELIAEILSDAIDDPEFARENENAINELFDEVSRWLDIPSKLIKRPG